MYMSQRYLPDERDQLPFHRERNLPRSRGSPPYFRNETNWNPDDNYSSSKYSREGRHISDHRIRERSLSPRERSRIPSRRSQEPDLRNYLSSSHRYDRNFSDIDRDGPNYNRTYKDEMFNRDSDWKYDRNIDTKSRMDQESMDLRNRELLSRRDCRDEKYLLDSERDRRYSDLIDERYDSRRGRYSPDLRDQLYLSEHRREDHLEYRDKIFLTDSGREKHLSDIREEARLSEFRRSGPSPVGRYREPSDSAMWPHRDERYQEFLTDSNRHWQNRDGNRNSEFERDWRHPDQTQDYLFTSQRDSRSSDPRYMDPLRDERREQYPERRYGRPFNDAPGMVPVNNGRTLNELNHQGQRMEDEIEDNWKNGHPSQWNIKESVFDVDNIGTDRRRLASFSPVNNAIPHREIPSRNTPFLDGNSLPTLGKEDVPLPKFTVLIQYLYNFNQPLLKRHAEYIKKLILRYWMEEKMKKPPGVWLPTFLECIRRPNGLAIVCADKRSCQWLLTRKLKGVKGFFFAATNAANPIKRVKLVFRVPDEGITPIEVLRKIHMCNRGNQISFDRFKVLSCKKGSGNLNIIVLADSWSANRMRKRLNWRPKYGNKRVRFLLMGKKKKKPPATQSGEVKQPKEESNGNLDELDEVEEDTFSESYDEL